MEPKGKAGVGSAGRPDQDDGRRPDSTAVSPPPSTRSRCSVCGQAFRRHGRCRACGVLLGAGHGNTSGPLCGGCEGQRVRSPEGAAQVAAAIKRGYSGG